VKSAVSYARRRPNELKVVYVGRKFIVRSTENVFKRNAKNFA